MRPSVLYSIAFAASAAYSQLILSGLFRKPTPPPRPDTLGDQEYQQHPLMDTFGPGPALPPGVPADGRVPSAPGPAGPAGPGSVMLSDVMGRDKSINIFAGFTRDIESVARRLDDPAQNSTVLAPLNSRIEALPRKPWEDPRDYGALGAEAYEGSDGHDRAHRNLGRFVEAHIIPSNPWKEGEKVEALAGDRDIWWEEKDGVKVVCSDVPFLHADDWGAVAN